MKNLAWGLIAIVMFVAAAISFLLGGYLFITIENDVVGVFAFVLSPVVGVFWGVRLLIYYEKVVRPDSRRWVKETLPRLVVATFFVAVMIGVVLVISSIPTIKDQVDELLNRIYPGIR